MKQEEIKELLYDRFIKPIEKKEKDYVGIEVEMPVVQLGDKPTDQEVARKAFNAFIEKYGFEPISYDEHGHVISATRPDNEDNLSFDCSFNNMEIAMGREEDIHAIDKRFKEYIGFLNDKLSKENHRLTGFGVNPHYDINVPDYIDAERYRILGRYIETAKERADHQYQHPYKGYGTYASASQVQLDIQKDELLDTLEAFSLAEPIKAVLFANSLFKDEPDFIAARDIFWENGPVGLNPHNVGLFETEMDDIDDFLEYLTTTSIFNVSRDSKYICFEPIPLNDYFNSDEIEGEYFDGETFQKIKFKPEPEDIKFLRTYKSEDLTFRGTVEFRSCCNQPFNEAMTVAAFHAGLIRKVPELLDLLKNDRVIYHHGYKASELRRKFVKKDWPGFVNKEDLKELTIKVLDLAKEGLKERGFDEEVYLDPLYKRAQTLKSPARAALDHIKDNVSLDEMILKYSEI